MIETTLVHELPIASANRAPEHQALTIGDVSLSYGALAQQITAFCNGLLACGVERAERVGVYLDKRVETVVGCLGTAAAGAAFVPLNPLLKPEQVGYILRDCNVRVLVTSPERFALLPAVLGECSDLRHVVLSGPLPSSVAHSGYALHRWNDFCDTPPQSGHRSIDTDMAAILYTSGSTGQPKGVVLSHRNVVAGAKSVASYLENTREDALLAVLPLSFDAGFSQLTTAFHVGARVVLLNYLVPKDVVRALVTERITGLTAVPPLYIQLAQQTWPTTITEHLRYFANTGGRMPLQTLTKLRTLLPKTKPYLMYGLTEAFRSTYLPPEEVDLRPDSIGRAIPNAEILVLREDGTVCAADEPGELVHRGALVAMGYWNDVEKTAERYKPLPGRETGLVLPEMAVFSGDTVRKDEDGFLYFIGRRDEMIKTSGYRVSPTEIEEVFYTDGRVNECAAFGVPHPTLGQAIVVVVTAHAGESSNSADLLAHCRERLPIFMVPARIDWRPGPLPRNPNGKIDRKAIAAEYLELFA